MNGLGLRLALAGGRGALVGLALTTLAVAMGTAILLFALSFAPAIDARFDRAAWRQPTAMAYDAEGEPTTPATWLSVVTDRYRGEPILRAGIGSDDPGAAVPPGIPRLPAPGEAYVSPALAERIAAGPDDELGDRFGHVVGIIGDGALRSPQELVAIVGMRVTDLRDVGSAPVAAFAGTPAPPDIPPILVLVIVLAIAGALAPVAVFVATATRLSAARREQRLAALRLVGATSSQVSRLAAVEALIPTIIGSLAGIGLFVLLRPLVALIPLDETTWFPDTIVPPLQQAVVLLALVPVVGTLAAVVALRRVVVTPLGVRRRETPRPPGIVRLVPLGVAVLVLLGGLSFWRSRSGEGGTALFVVGIAFASIIVGIALAGPWLTALIGRILRLVPGGAATLLASRRMTDDPRGSFGAIAGVVMAVFVASAFFTFAAYARSQVGIGDVLMRDGQVSAELPYGSGPSLEALPATLADLPGVTDVLVVRGAEVFVDGEPVAAWIAPCDQLIRTLDVPGAACGGGRIHTAQFDLAGGTAMVVPDRGASRGADRQGHDVAFAGDDIVPIGPAIALGIQRLPSLIIEPGVLGDALPSYGVSRLYVTTDGSTGAEERVRTVVIRAAATSRVRLTAERRAGEPMYDEFGRVVALGLVGTLVLAGCSLTVAVTTGILERRRQLALLRSAGMPASQLRALVLLQAGVPLVVVALTSAVLGMIIAQAVLSLADAPEIPFPDATFPLTLIASLIGALGLVAMTLPALERLTRPDLMRLE